MTLCWTAVMRCVGSTLVGVSTNVPSLNKLYKEMCVWSSASTKQVPMLLSCQVYQMAK